MHVLCSSRINRFPLSLSFAFFVRGWVFFCMTTGTKHELSSVQAGGALKIHQIDSSQDSGIYTCTVRNRAGEEARRDIELTVNSKWKSWTNEQWWKNDAVLHFRSASYRTICIPQESAGRWPCSGHLCRFIRRPADYFQLEKRRSSNTNQFAGERLLGRAPFRHRIDEFLCHFPIIDHNKGRWILFDARFQGYFSQAQRQIHVLRIQLGGHSQSYERTFGQR